MKKTILAALTAAAAVTAVAVPAMAQPYGGPGGYGEHRQGMGERPGGWDIDQRIKWIGDRIRRGRDDGSLDRREAARVDRELRSIHHADMDFRMSHGGHLDDAMRADLSARLDRLNDQIHWLRETNDRRPW